MPPAARVTDRHNCPIDPPNSIVSGAETVFVGYQQQARVGDKEGCGATITAGEPTVIIADQDAARKGDPTSHGGVIASGCPTVLIGSNAQAETLITDKPFCEECAKKALKKAQQAARGRDPS